MSDEKPQKPKRQPKQQPDATARQPRKPAGKAKLKSESEKQAVASIEPNENASVGRPTPESQKSEIEHPTSEIKAMEVHHHPQLDHSPKPIKEYLLEGFMIFIAVMMGFIAENIREYIDNNEQVKHLTSQLVQDLRADTIQLNHIYREEDSIYHYNDTLISLLKQPLAKADTRRIQKMVANSHSMWLFHPSAGALGAIKSQVHLKQFSNSEIIRYFAQYERHIELVHTAQDINLQYQRSYLDPFITAHFTPANLEASFENYAQPTPQMRNLTQGDLDQLATDMVLMRIITHEMLIDNQTIKADAVSLMEYVKKQYDPEE